MNKKLKKWLPLFILVMLIAAAYNSPLKEYLSFEYIQQNRDHLLELNSRHPLLFPLAFIGIYTASTALSLPFGTVLAVVGGFLFGPYIGLFHVLIGATLGATILFIIAENTAGDALEKKAGKFYHKAEKRFKENATSYMLFMRLVPLFPFAIVNILPALFNIPLRTYVWTTFIGIIPGTFAHTYFGQALSETTSIQNIVSKEMIIALCLLGGLALLPILIKQFKRKKTS